MSEGAAALVGCHECGCIHAQRPLPSGAQAFCSCCGSLLYGAPTNSLRRSLALALSALVLFLLANLYPFITLDLAGRSQPTWLLTAGWALHQEGMWALGMLVAVTSVVFPLLVMTGLVYLLIPAVRGQAAPALGPVLRAVLALLPWSLLGVFLLATLVAFVKLMDLANVLPGPGLVAFVAAMLAFSATRAQLDPDALWRLAPVPQWSPQQWRGEALVQCHGCGLLRPPERAPDRCPRCMAPMHYRQQQSVERTWALLVAAVILFIPANVYPMMTVRQLGQGAPDTIVSGVVRLIDNGYWGLGLVVFFASLVIPVAKLASLAWLLWSVQRGVDWRPHDRTRLYRFTELVGAWSMVDVYLVGLLSGLVSFGVLASVTPGLGSLFFAAVVVLTMFAAASFDPRLIWDALPPAAVPSRRQGRQFGGTL